MTKNTIKAMNIYRKSDGKFMDSYEYSAMFAATETDAKCDFIDWCRYVAGDWRYTNYRYELVEY